MKYLVLMGVCLSLTLSGCQVGGRDAAAPAGPNSAGAAPDPVERGKYLVTIVGCHDCHTPMRMGANGPEPDMTRMLSGHPESLILPPPPKTGDGPWAWMGAATNTAFAGPWGVTYAANLTPDELTGMKIWTEEMFVRSLREGRHMGTSRVIQPPMPWPWYRNMTDADLKAIYAYLRTIPAISNHVPDYQEPRGGEAPK